MSIYKRLPIRKEYVIKGARYRVYESAHELNDVEDGLVDLETKTIFLRPGLSVHEKRQVLLHELMHAHWYEMHFHCLAVSEEAEELIVDSFASFFLSLK